jgi:16S rRNA (uracil1498-N3)-methyltransferase
MREVKKFVIEKFINENRATINPKYYHYLKDVLRLKTPDKILAMDGKGNMFEGELIQLQKNSILVKIHQKVECFALNLHICCAFSIPKGDRFFFLIEKLTEIGIREILPVQFERSIKYTFTKDSVKFTRAINKIEMALMQSGNVYKPNLYETMAFQAFLEHSKQYDGKFYGSLLQESQQIQISSSTFNYNKILYVIGPEGGYTFDEEKKLKEYGFTAVNINPYTLRIETAALLLGGIITFFKTLTISPLL